MPLSDTQVRKAKPKGKPLTDTEVRKAKPENNPYKMGDGGGLFLLVNPNGAKYWRLKYRINGKEKALAIGVYPDVSLADARERRGEARKLLAAGTDPGDIRRAQKASRLDAAANSFEVVARRWHERGVSEWSESYANKVIRLLDKEVFPWIGRRAVDDLEAPDFLLVGRKIESRGIIDTAHRAMQLCGQVMRFAVAEGVSRRNPVADLRGALSPAPKTKHMASVTDPTKVGELLRAFGAFAGTPVVQSALRLAPYLFVRIGELRTMKWADLDFDAAVWSIPAEAMKMREPHLVPLCTQAIEILKDLQPLTGNGEYVFTGGRDPRRPMSDAAINAALRRLGVDTQNELTGHGFRAMARTILHERLGYQPEVIEVQLAHRVPGPLGAAYARAKFIDQRTTMMQTWADYLDDVREGGKVIRLSGAAA